METGTETDRVDPLAGATKRGLLEVCRSQDSLAHGGVVGRLPRTFAWDEPGAPTAQVAQTAIALLVWGIAGRARERFLASVRIGVAACRQGVMGETGRDESALTSRWLRHGLRRGSRRSPVAR